MLVCLRHWTISCCNYEDGTIHLGSTCNHVLNVICVAWAVYVSVVTGSGLILYVSGVNGDTALLLFRSVIDLVERLDLRKALAGKYLCDSCGQSGLTVVNMADSTNVNMRFIPLKNFFCHNIMYKCVLQK